MSSPLYTALHVEPLVRLLPLVIGLGLALIWCVDGSVRRDVVRYIRRKLRP